MKTVWQAEQRAPYSLKEKGTEQFSTEQGSTEQYGTEQYGAEQYDTEQGSTEQHFSTLNNQSRVIWDKQSKYSLHLTKYPLSCHIIDTVQSM